MRDATKIAANQIKNDVVLKVDAWVNQMEFINQLILNNNILISILAKTKGDQTSFGKLLCANLPSGTQSCMLTANLMFDDQLFLFQMGKHLGFKVKTDVNAFVEQSLKHKVHTVVVIDDAHHLTADFLDLLLIALSKQDTSGYFHVCLLSDYSLVQTLTDLALVHNDMIHSIELKSVNHKKAKTALIAPVKRIRLDKHLAAPISLLASAVLALSAVAYFWQPSSKQLENSKPIVIVKNNPLNHRFDILTSQIPNLKNNSVMQALQSSRPLRQREITAFIGEDELTDDSMVVIDKVIVIPKVIQSQARRQVPSAQNQLQIASYESVKKAISAYIVTSSTINKNYTIQLLAGRNKPDIERFIRVHQIKGKATIFRTNPRWYVLAVGEYQDRSQAMQAIVKLPNELIKLKPWVRSLSKLQLIG